MKILKKIRNILAVAALFALIGASIIPSAVMPYALNLTKFGSALVLAFTILMVFTHESAVRNIVKKARDEGKLDERQRKAKRAPRRVSIVCIPVILALVISSHWVIGLFWFAMWFALLGVSSITAIRLKEEIARSKRV